MLWRHAGALGWVSTMVMMFKYLSYVLRISIFVLGATLPTYSLSNTITYKDEHKNWRGESISAKDWLSDVKSQNVQSSLLGAQLIEFWNVNEPWDRFFIVQEVLPGSALHSLQFSKQVSPNLYERDIGQYMPIRPGYILKFPALPDFLTKDKDSSALHSIEEFLRSGQLLAFGNRPGVEVIRPQGSSSGVKDFYFGEIGERNNYYRIISNCSFDDMGSRRCYSKFYVDFEVRQVKFPRPERPLPRRSFASQSIQVCNKNSVDLSFAITQVDTSNISANLMSRRSRNLVIHRGLYPLRANSCDRVWGVTGLSGFAFFQNGSLINEEIKDVVSEGYFDFGTNLTFVCVSGSDYYFKVDPSQFSEIAFERVSSCAENNGRAFDTTFRVRVPLEAKNELTIDIDISRHQIRAYTQ